MASKDVPLIHAAIALHRGYWAVRSLVLRGELRGFLDARGHWRVDAADLDRLVREQEREQRIAGEKVPA